MIFKISPDGSGNPFFNCFGFKPKAIKKRLQRTAGKWLVDKSQTICFYYYFTTSTHCPLVRARKSLSYIASHCKPGR